FWIGKGAKPSDTIARLMKGMGVARMDRYVIHMADRSKKNPTEEEIASAETKNAKNEPAESAPEEKEEPSSVASEQAPLAQDVASEVEEVQKQEETPAQPAQAA